MVENTGWTKREAETAVTAFIETVSDAVADGNGALCRASTPSRSATERRGIQVLRRHEQEGPDRPAQVPRL